MTFETVVISAESFGVATSDLWIAGGIGVAGTLMGVLVTAWVQRRADNLRWSREKADERIRTRQTAYSRFLVVTGQTYGRFLTVVSGVHFVRGLDAFRDLQDRVIEVLSEVSLVGSADLIQQAREVSDALEEIAEVVSAHMARRPRHVFRPAQLRGFSQLEERYLSAREAFRSVAQREVFAE